MADHGGGARGQRRIDAADFPHEEDRDRALEHVAQQRCRGEALAAGAQNIGRADITGADAANVTVRDCPVEELDDEAGFDTILCFNVLEHIAADEAVLTRFASLLRPGGSLLLLVPAHPAAYGRIDDILGHERRYAKRELAQKLEFAGLEVARLRHVNPVGIVGWFVTSRLLRATQVPSGPLRLYDRLVPVLRLIDRLPVPFGLSLWAVARRPE